MVIADNIKFLFPRISFRPENILWQDQNTVVTRFFFAGIFERKDLSDRFLLSRKMTDQHTAAFMRIIPLGVRCDCV